MSDLGHSTSLAPPLSIKVFVPSQESDRSGIYIYICTKGINLVFVSTISLLSFGNVLIGVFALFSFNGTRAYSLQVSHGGINEISAANTCHK